MLKPFAPVGRIDITPYTDSRREAIVQLTLRAWAPVFASIERVMDPEVYREHHPDWRVTQQQAVEAACADPDVPVWVASEGAQTIGFIALKRHSAERLGEIYMMAVDPDSQQRGIATALMAHAFAWFKAVGMTTVMADTGGDPGHAPARRAYESVGFRPFPVARYFKKL